MMGLAVSLITALILIVFGLLRMVVMAFGAYGSDTSNGLAALIGGAVLMTMTIIIVSILSGWLAHVLQTRSGISPWLVGRGWSWR